MRSIRIWREKMKRILSSLLVLLLVLAGCSSSPKTNGETKNKKQIVSTIYPVTYLVQRIVGDKYEVKQLLPTQGNAHDWEPTPQEIVEIDQAALFVYNGAGMEEYVEDVLASLNNKELKTVEASHGIELLAHGHHHHHEDDDHEAEHEHEHEHEEEHEHEHGHHHHDHDPHTFNTPKNLLVQAKNIYEGVIAIDADNKAEYTKNYEALVKDLEQISKEYDESLTNLAHKEFIVSHEAFGYLAHQYGLEQIGVEGLNPNSEPDPARLAELIETVKEHGIKVIFFEDEASSKVAETIAKETGAKVATLYPMARLTQEQVDAKEDLLSVLRKNLQALSKALK